MTSRRGWSSKKWNAWRELKRVVNGRGVRLIQEEVQILGRLPPGMQVEVVNRWVLLLNKRGIVDVPLGLCIRDSDLESVLKAARGLSEKHGIWCELNGKVCAVGDPRKRNQISTEPSRSLPDNNRIYLLDPVEKADNSHTCQSAESDKLGLSLPLPEDATEWFNQEPVRVATYVKEQFAAMLRSVRQGSAQYCSFSNNVITPYLRHVVQAKDTSNLSTVMWALHAIVFEERHMPDSIDARMKRSPHAKNIRLAFNIFCAHVDMCRITYLQPNIAVFRDMLITHWNLAGRIFNSVGWRLDDQHYSMIEKAGKSMAPEYDRDTHLDPHIPPLSIDLLNFLIIPHCLWQIPFVELKEQCWDFLEVFLDPDMLREMWSIAGCLPHRQQEDARCIAQGRYRPGDLPDTPEPPSVGANSSEVTLRDMCDRLDAAKDVRGRGGRRPMFRHNPAPKQLRIDVPSHLRHYDVTNCAREPGTSPLPQSSREEPLLTPKTPRRSPMFRHNSAPKQPRIDVPSHLRHYDEPGISLLPQRSGEEPLLTPKTSRRRPRVLVPATPLTIERRREGLSFSSRKLAGIW